MGGSGRTITRERKMRTHMKTETTESVWDYPRPPRVEKTDRLIRIVHGGEVLAGSTRSFRVLETSHPPTYYMPDGDIRMDMLVLNNDHTVCEFKGLASYYDLVAGDITVPDVAWTYLNPRSGYEDIKGYIAFYARKLDACYVDGEKVDAQAGSFYGGWITSHITGPFKGSAGTAGW
jgi:uncharacterized protein (DUF427 family)